VFFFHSLRSGMGFLSVVAVAVIILIMLNGCSDTSTSPETTNNTSAPVLPATEQLQFDFSFFESATRLEKSHGQHDNFNNAYVRTVVLDVMARFVLAAPTGAFSAALNTIPVAQEDGSWVWTYNWNTDNMPLGISLLG